MKIWCSSCKNWKIADQYNKEESEFIWLEKPQYFRKPCKACVKQYKREWVMKQGNTYSKNYAIRNKEKIKRNQLRRKLRKLQERFEIRERAKKAAKNTLR